MLLFGVISPSEALASINWNTILLLLGMMLTVSAMEASGFFAWISNMIANTSHKQFTFLVYTSCLTALLSALILNDAVVLIFTPVIIMSARRLGISPVPPLIMEAISANIGSAATEVGNPQNAYIASVSLVGFHTFTEYILPVTLVSLLASFGIAFLLSGRNGQSVCDSGETVVVKKVPLLFMLSSVVAIFAAFYTSSITHFPIAAIALIGGVVNFFAMPLLTNRSSQELLVRVDWGILLFFIGLFILIAGIQDSGLLKDIVSVLTLNNNSTLHSTAGLNIVTAVLSNLVSNVPAVLLLTPAVAAGANVKLWVTLAASSTFAGNATIIGAAANVIVARSAAREGVTVTLKEFMKYGLPVTVLSLLFTYLLI